MSPKAHKVPITNISPADTVIAFMGQTGAGKSTFINAVTRKEVAAVGHKLKACTKKVEAFRCPQLHDGRSLVLVDTPGFDDTTKSDAEILRLLADWLSTTYRNGITLAGIVYLHRISDRRMAGSPQRNLHIFRELCGEEAMQNVIVATSMWDEIKLDVAEAREKELQGEFWKPMLDLGSATARFYNSFESAWSIVETILSQSSIPRPLLLQQELVDLKLLLSQTSAGVALCATLQSLLEEREAANAQVQMQRTLDTKRRSAERQGRIDKKIRRIISDIQEMKITRGRHILMFFTFRKPYDTLASVQR